MQRFSGGLVIWTPEAEAVLSGEVVRQGLNRHFACDWGEVSERTAKANALAFREGYQIRSMYRDPNGVRFMIVTAGNRETMTIKLLDKR